MTYVLDLFSGIGGFSLGLKLAEPRARTVCYVEREAFCVAHLVHQMQEGRLDRAPICTDIREFDGRRWAGVVDLITAGFPCQPASLAGKQLGPKDERWLWPSLREVIRDVEPGRVLLENVPGIRKWLPDIIGDLADIGFDAEWDCFSAAGVGAPHLRKRWFCLATHPEREQLRVESGRIGGKDREGPSESRDDDETRDLAYPERQRLALGESVRRDPEQERPPPERSGPSSRSRSLPAVGVGTHCRGREQIGVEGREPDHESPRGDEPDGLCGPWATESGFQRVVDGVPYRVDRLRALGNGVVPLVVAHAYRILSARLTAPDPV